MKPEELRAEEGIPGYSKMLDDLTKLMADVVPTPIFASSVLFPSDGAWHFRDGKQEYFCSGAAFWKGLPADDRVTFTLGNSVPLSSIDIIDIDHPSAAGMREKVVTALLAAFPKDPTHDH